LQAYYATLRSNLQSASYYEQEIAMTNAVVVQSDQPAAGPNAGLTAGAILAAWLAVIVFLAAGGTFVRPPGTPPLTLLAGVAVPIIVFLAAFRTSRPFRDFVMTADLRVVTAIQAWRFAGFGFVALYQAGRRS
jgi:hypothetical protein